MIESLQGFLINENFNWAKNKHSGFIGLFIIFRDRVSQVALAGTRYIDEAGLDLMTPACLCLLSMHRAFQRTFPFP